jgi:quinohemoprotein ethanol dehydrogenase
MGLLICLLAVVARANAAAEDEWPEAGRDLAGTYHSPLEDINRANVKRLGFAWDYPLGTHRGLEATPLVIGGVLYVSGNFGRVYALDAASGRELWTYNPDIAPKTGRHACCDAVNRGVAVRDGRVYVAALDGYLHALDAKTGRQVWKADTLPSRTPTATITLTGAPVIAGKLVVIGTAGGDFAGARGYVVALDRETGAVQWRFYTVPRDPSLGAQDQPHLAAAISSWDPHHRWEAGGGGVVWDGISYDAALDRIYVGTGNASPYDLTEGGRMGGDSLYSNSILALDAASGTLVWAFQVLPGDKWDLDSTQKLILANLAIDGRTRRVLMQASKNGYFYVLDRESGDFISARPFAFANWLTRMDSKTGRPTLNPAADYSQQPRLIFPWEGGAHSWQPMSFDPLRRRVFIPVVEAGDIQLETANRPAGLTEGQFTSPIIGVEDYDPHTLAGLYGELPPLASLTRGLPSATALGYLRAWDPAQQRRIWQVQTATYWNGGVLSTAGGLVIQGDIEGQLNIYDADNGKLLKRLALGTSVMATPMTYRVDGIQYIALLAGYGGGQIGDALPQNSAAYRYGNAGRLIALKLDGPTPPLPTLLSVPPPSRPPADQASDAQLAAGEKLYNRFCARCHVLGRGVLPDLRHLTPEKQLFQQIVRGGMLEPLGMSGFDDVLSEEDVDAIRGYLIHDAWREYSEIDRQ